MARLSKPCKVNDKGRECSSCREFKPWDEYHLSSSGIRGHRSECNECRSGRYDDDGPHYRMTFPAWYKWTGLAIYQG
jgi:hypothetical protein